MINRTVGFAIKVTQARESQETSKALDKQRKTLIDMPKRAEQFGKVLKLNLKGVREEAKRTETETKSLGRSFVDGFKEAAIGVDRFMSRLDRIKGKILNVKNVIAASAIGGVGIYLAREVFRKGFEQAANVGRVRREFGSDAGYLLSLGEKVGRRAGIEGDDAARALVPLAEQLQAIQAGARFRGMKKPLSENEAAALRRKNLNFGAELLGRETILAPEVDSGELGKVLADALTGPEGVRSLISTLNLSKRSRTLSSLNEQGKVFQALSPEERKRFGISRAGQFLEQGDLVNLMLERSGLTGKEAEAKRRGFAGQVRALKSTFTDALGDVGVAAVDALNKKLGEGTSLADKLRNYLDKNPEIIKKIGEGLATGAKAIADIAMKLPEVASFLSDHKTLLLALGGGALGLKGVGALGGLLSKVPVVGKAADALNAIPVRVTNWGDAGGMPGLGGAGGAPGLLSKGKGLLGLLGGAGGQIGLAGVAGLAYGALVGYGLDKGSSYLEDKTGVNLNPFGGFTKKDLAAKDAEIAAAKQERDRRRFQRWQSAHDPDRAFGPGDAPGINDFLARTQEQKDQVFGPGDAPGLAQFRQQQQSVSVSIPVTLDGFEIARVMVPHLARYLNNASARGAAPGVPGR